jgi:predicted dithiol-disulfide oxidoreductase (DUF899 family)
MHELAAARKRMPMVRVERDYGFEGRDGRRSLPKLFDGRSSSFADGIPEFGLLHSRDITFAMASPAPQANLQRYAERMGWTGVRWYTIRSERFSADFGVDEWFGFNVSCVTAKTCTAPTSFSTGRWSSSSAASGACGP